MVENSTMFRFFSSAATCTYSSTHVLSVCAASWGSPSVYVTHRKLLFGTRRLPSRSARRIDVSRGVETLKVTVSLPAPTNAVSGRIHLKPNLRPTESVDAPRSAEITASRELRSAVLARTQVLSDRSMCSSYWPGRNLSPSVKPAKYGRFAGLVGVR